MAVFIITFLLMTSSAFASVHPFWRTAAFFDAAFEVKFDWNAGFKAFIQYQPKDKKTPQINSEPSTERYLAESNESQTEETKVSPLPETSEEETSPVKTQFIEPEPTEPELKICYYIVAPQKGIPLSTEDTLEVLYNEQLNLESAIKERFDGLFNLEYIEKNVNTARDSKKRSSKEINDKEKELKKLSISNQGEGNYKLWENRLPDFSELEDLIVGRKELLGQCDSGDLNWLISNSYQRYALEYINRYDGNAERIFYGYTNCILYAEQALTYNKYTSKSQKLILKYIKARYKDIADCTRIDSIDVTIRPRASEIESAIEKYISDKFIE